MREPVFKQRPRAKASAALMLAMLTSGCAWVGRDYQAPPATLDASFIGAGAAKVNSEPVSSEIAAFWRGFNDAELSALVERALQANGDVRIAQARLQESRANRSEIDTQTLPSISLDANCQACGFATLIGLPVDPQPAHRCELRCGLRGELGAGFLRRGTPREGVGQRAGRRQPGEPGCSTDQRGGPKLHATTWKCAGCSCATTSRRPLWQISVNR